MGGYGSGRWGYGHHKRTTVEECRHLDVRHLRRRGLLEAGQMWQGLWWWRTPDGEEKASVDLTATAAQVVVSYTIRHTYGPEADREPERVSYAVPVVWTPMFREGRRPWFLCPGRNCGRRVAKLYLPVYADAKYFLCRHCYGLSYESRQTWNKREAFYRKHPQLALAVMGSKKASHAERMAAIKAGLRGRW